MKKSTEILTKKEETPRRLGGILKLFNRIPTGEHEPTSAQPRSYNPDRIVHPAQPEGGRSLEIYEKQLRFDRQELEEKRVLDLGSGPKAKFAAELEEAGIHAKIVSLSPDYSSPKYADPAKEAYNKNLIAGVGEALPFQNESFDRVFALHTHTHIKQPDAFLTEIARVLAPGGEARIAPDVMFASIYTYLENNVQLQQQLADEGVRVECEPIPREVYTERQIDPGGHKVTVGARVIVLTKDNQSNE